MLHEAHLVLLGVLEQTEAQTPPFCTFCALWDLINFHSPFAADPNVSRCCVSRSVLGSGARAEVIWGKYIDTDVENGFQESNEMFSPAKHTLLDNSVVLALITVSFMTGRNWQLHSAGHVPAVKVWKVESIADLCHWHFSECWSAWSSSLVLCYSECFHLPNGSWCTLWIHQLLYVTIKQSQPITNESCGVLNTLNVTALILDIIQNHFPSTSLQGSVM